MHGENQFTTRTTNSVDKKLPLEWIYWQEQLTFKWAINDFT